MFKLKWTSRDLNTYADWQEVYQHIKELQPQICAFDTETTGLHIKHDKPFLFQFGFVHPLEPDKGYTFLVDFRYNKDARRIVNEWHDIVKNASNNLAHNVKFDVHMLDNIGINFQDDNLDDTQFYIRYGSDALHVKEGGAPTELKEFAARYIDHSAKYHEKLLDHEKTQQVKKYNMQLKSMLQVLGAPPPEYGAKSYTISVVEKMFKDPLFDISDLTEDVRKIYLQWKGSLPTYLQHKIDSTVENELIRYDTLSKENLYKYAHLDIVYVIETYLLMKPLVEYRGNMKAIDLERSLILPFFDMECTGFIADAKYLEESRVRLRDYALRRREDFYALAGCKVSIGQHAKIKQILWDRFGAQVESTGNDELETYKNGLLRDDPNNPVIEFINILSELRTLEKWYPTYILRFQKDLEFSERLYTSINQVGAISGRVSSDFQQFPKAAIVDNQGNELFHPRKIVQVPDYCKGLLYLDYSQVELRFQAMYTILVGHPDLNMCRAYMPYKCHLADGTQFDYNNIAHIKNWKADWLLNETNEKWTPTDIHGATTLAAFSSIGLTKESENFHALRYVGKRVDFAKNYGASLNKIIEMFPEYTIEQCKEIDAAYYTAFPGVKAYHNYCFQRAQCSDHTTNMFGINYYNANGHKLRNLLVQGSAAHFLKYRIRALWEFLKENGYKSRMQLQIHDELVFELHKDDPPLAKKLKAIMEDWDDAMVPIVAEGEVTNTTWADKRELEI